MPNYLWWLHTFIWQDFSTNYILWYIENNGKSISVSFLLRNFIIFTTYFKWKTYFLICSLEVGLHPRLCCFTHIAESFILICTYVPSTVLNRIRLRGNAQLKDKKINFWTFDIFYKENVKLTRLEWKIYRDSATRKKIVSNE